MEATPADVNVAQLVRDLMRIPEVEDIHDLHVWSLAGGMPLLTAHVQVGDSCSLSRCAEIITELNGQLQAKYAITHTTIQLECARCAESELHCALIPSPRAAHVHEDHDHSHEHEARARFIDREGGCPCLPTRLLMSQSPGWTAPTAPTTSRMPSPPYPGSGPSTSFWPPKRPSSSLIRAVARLYPLGSDPVCLVFRCDSLNE